VFFRAFQHGLGAAWDAVTTTEATHAFWLTIFVVAIAVPLDTIFGVGVAMLLARRRFPGAWLLDAAIDIPLALSPVVVGLGLVLVYGKAGWFGNWLAARGIEIIFSVPGIVMASATVALPYVARSVLPVLLEIGTEQEQAARTLGAGPVAIFLRITLPSIRRSLAYGVTLTTARVLGEFGAVAIVSGAIVDKTQTMTLFIDDSFNNLDPIGAYAGAVILALLSLLVLLILGGDRDKRREQQWQSPSVESPNGTETLLPVTT
jgi:sulfate transport system permease protein